MKTVDLTLKAYVEVFIVRWSDRPHSHNYADLLYFLKLYHSEWRGCEMTADEIITYLWWRCMCPEQRLVMRLVHSYRQFCARHGLKYETITFKMKRL